MSEIPRDCEYILFVLFQPKVEPVDVSKTAAKPAVQPARVPLTSVPVAPAGASSNIWSHTTAQGHQLFVKERVSHHQCDCCQTARGSNGRKCS